MGMYIYRALLLNLCKLLDELVDEYMGGYPYVKLYMPVVASLSEKIMEP